jgi:hypothetical protein
MVESEVGTESHPGPGTESDQEEPEGHDTTVYVSFYSSERIHTGHSEAIAQIEHLALNILEQIVAPLKRSQPGSVVGTQSHRQGKVEIQIADRRKDRTGG